MVFHMKTTLLIDDTVFARLKSEAQARQTTISELVEAALRAFLARGKRSAAALPPLPAFSSGGALVDVADRDALFRAMEEE